MRVLLKYRCLPLKSKLQIEVQNVNGPRKIYSCGDDLKKKKCTVRLGVRFDRTNHKVCVFFSRTAYFAFYHCVFLNETVYDNKSHTAQ